MPIPKPVEVRRIFSLPAPTSNAVAEGPFKNNIPLAADRRVFVPIVTPALNVAAPASDISSFRAVIEVELSVPTNKISLSAIEDSITKSLPPLMLNSPKAVPLSFKNISPPSASRIISPATSSVKSPEVLLISPVT